MRRYTLLGCLPVVLLGGLELLLEHIDAALEDVHVGLVALALLPGGVRLAQLGLGLLEVLLKHREAVLQARDLLLLGQVVLLQLLVPLLSGLGALQRLVRLGAQRVQLLLDPVLHTTSVPLHTGRRRPDAPWSPLVVVVLDWQAVPRTASSLLVSGANRSCCSRDAPPRAPRRCELGKWRHTRPSPQRTMASEHRVELYVYDLTQGLARQLSPALLGQQIDGVWHSAIVAWGREIFFGHGISIVAPPGTTHVRGALGGAAADRVAR